MLDVVVLTVCSMVQVRQAAWTAAFRPQEHEFADIPLVVRGALPPDLKGTFFKNGPARFERGADKYSHWLDGDGYSSASP